MIRILHIISGLEMAGSQILLHKLLSAMDRSRFSSAVVSLADDGGHLGPLISELGVPVHGLKIHGAASGIRGLVQTAGVIRSFRPDVIQTWLHHADLFGTIAARLSGNRNVVWNLQCSSFSPNEITRRHRYLVRLLGMLSAVPRLVISISEAGREAHIDEGYHPRRWEIVPNCFDIRAFAPDAAARTRAREQLALSEDQVVVGIIGRYHPMKGHALFLSAAEKLAARRSDVVFVMAGMGLDAQNGEIVRLIHERGLAGRVRLLGVWPDMSALMNGLDVLALSSTTEGFPSVVGEAMACGVPCVATDVGDCRAIIGDTGRVVAPGDSSAFAAACEELLALAPDVRRRLGAAARERICGAYSIDAVVSRYQQLYEELAGGSDGRSKINAAHLDTI